LGFSRALKAEFFEQAARIGFCNGQLRVGQPEYIKITRNTSIFPPVWACRRTLWSYMRCWHFPGGALVSTGIATTRLQAEGPLGLVKKAEKTIIANDYDYALAA